MRIEHPISKKPINGIVLGKGAILKPEHMYPSNDGSWRQLGKTSFCGQATQGTLGDKFFFVKPFDKETDNN